MSGEKDSLIGAFRTKRGSKGYGSAPSSARSLPSPAPGGYSPAAAVLLHTVSRGDTLAGVALKYGVTPETLKRLNNLYTSDSLYLRSILKVPAPLVKSSNGGLLGDSFWDASPDDIEVDLNGAAADERPQVEGQGVGEAGGDNNERLKGAERVPERNGATAQSEPKELSVLTPAQRSESPTFGDFFSKFDSSVGALKTKVNQQVDSRLTLEDDIFCSKSENNGNPTGTMNGGDWSHQRKSHRLSSSSTNSLTQTPEPVVRTKLQRKMDKLEDEMFQL